MPRIIYKAQPSDEVYVDWTTVADGPCNILTREDIDNPEFADAGISREEWHRRLDRADATGTSEHYGAVVSAWGNCHVVQHLYGPGPECLATIRHEDVLTYTLLCFAGQGEAAWALCTQIDDVA